MRLVKLELGVSSVPGAMYYASVDGKQIGKLQEYYLRKAWRWKNTSNTKQSFAKLADAAKDLALKVFGGQVDDYEVRLML